MEITGRVSKCFEPAASGHSIQLKLKTGFEQANCTMFPERVSKRVGDQTVTGHLVARAVAVLWQGCRLSARSLLGEDEAVGDQELLPLVNRVWEYLLQLSDLVSVFVLDVARKNCFNIGTRPC